MLLCSAERSKPLSLKHVFQPMHPTPLSKPALYFWPFSCTQQLPMSEEDQVKLRNDKTASKAKEGLPVWLSNISLCMNQPVLIFHLLICTCRSSCLSPFIYTATLHFHLFLSVLSCCLFELEVQKWKRKQQSQKGRLPR